MKSVSQFRRWLEAKIHWAEGLGEFNESEHQEAEALLSEAYDYAIDLKLLIHNFLQYLKGL